MTAFITRDISESSEFKKLLAAAGWQVEGRSLVALAPVLFRDIPDCDWMFFSSKNAVRFFFQNVSAMEARDLTTFEKLSNLPRVKWAALGTATAKVLAEYVEKVDFTGTGEPRGTAAGFRRVNPTPDPSPTGRGDLAPEGAAVNVASPLPMGEGSGVGLRVLFPAARHSRQSVMSLLTPDFQCIHFEVYDNRPIAEPPFSGASVLVFTSPMNAQAYFSKHILEEKQRVVAIGETTAGALRELGIAEIEMAAEPTERGLAEAVLRLQG